MCSSSRESIMYQSSHFQQATPLALSLISDTVLNPAFLAEELEAQKDAARYEIRELNSKPEMILPEVLHGVAYGHRTLGNPLLCPEERIDLIDEKMLRSCMKDWYRPERMVIAGSGMLHAELVEWSDKYLSSLKSLNQTTVSRPNAPLSHTSPPLLPSSSPSIYKSLTRAASSCLYPTPFSNSGDSSHPLNSLPGWSSSYTGGHRFILDTAAELNHVYIAFEGVGIHDEDIYTLATMQVLLGGGGSFSAGKTHLHSHCSNTPIS
jgi:mitochondrial-processing peptidase subunit alpha